MDWGSPFPRTFSIIKGLRNQKISSNILKNLTTPIPLLQLSLFLQIFLIKLRFQPPQRDNSCWDNILSASLLLLCWPIWALPGLNFSYKTVTTERKGWFLTVWPPCSWTPEKTGQKKSCLKLQNQFFFARSIYLVIYLKNWILTLSILGEFDFLFLCLETKGLRNSYLI